MQIPVLNGIYTDSAADFRTSYPRNMIPVPKNQGISTGYLRPADGIELFAVGADVDRGGVSWNGTLYRVIGTKLVSIDQAGVITTLGDVGGSGQVIFDYSFDRLGIESSGNLFYWNGVLTQVTDVDLGVCVDFIWVDGYFMSTDGTYLIVTDLNNPLDINPLKYGSSEADPDPIKALVKLRNEPLAVNRYTIETFDNVGGSLFPFARIEGAQIQKGAIGTHAVCLFMDQIAFVGSGRNESPAVWVGANSTVVKVSTREIETILQEYSETELSAVLIEARTDKSHSFLYVHLPDKTLVYDAMASIEIKEPVWFIVDSGIEVRGQYRAKNMVWVYDKWICGDPTTNNIGVLTDKVMTHYGDGVSWEFGTTIIYNEGKGAIFHELELVALPGRVALGDDPVVWTSFSIDGMTYSQERMKRIGKVGERNKRIMWLQNGSMGQWRIQKFRGNSDAFMSIARLEATLEALSV